MPKVHLEHHGRGVWLLTLSDPGRQNPMGPEMREELLAATCGLRTLNDARALILTGEGKTFCAGADLSAIFSGEPSADLSSTHAMLRSYYQVFFSVRDLPFPTIAAVNGPAIGAGLNLAMACDMRIAGREATFGATFSRIGVHPGGGCSWFLVRTLGASRALRTLLTGDTIDAERASAWGLAEGPEADPLRAALDLAQQIASTDGELARHIKCAVGIALETDNLNAVLEYECWAQSVSTSSAVFREWVGRFH